MMCAILLMCVFWCALGAASPLGDAPTPAAPGSSADTSSEPRGSLPRYLQSAGCVQLLASSAAQGGAPLQVGIRLPQHRFWLDRLVGEITVTEGNGTVYHAPVLFQLPAASGHSPNATTTEAADAADAWLVPAHELSELMARGVAADVGRLLQADRSSGWWDVAPQYREALALYGGTVAAVPLGAGPLLMFVRSDVLAAAGQAVPPQSWQALLAFAERYNGMRRLHDPPHALCLPAGPDCTRLHLLHAVWASVAQTRGRRQGLYFDPRTGAPRLDTAALHYALQLVANLTAAAAPRTRAGLPGAAAACGMGTAAAAADDGCMCTSAADINADSTPLSSCSCAVTLTAGTDHMQAIRECIQEVRPVGARYQVFGAPGSETVWKEDDDTLAPCNAETCPGADVLEALEVSAAAPIAVAAGTAAVQDLPTDAAGTARQALVNRSPWLTAVSLVGVINSRSSPEAQMRSYLLLSALALRLRCQWAGNNTAGPLDGSGALARMGLVGDCYAGQLDAAQAAAAASSSYDAAAELWRDVLRVSRADAMHPNADWDLGMAASQQQLRTVMLGLLANATSCGALHLTGIGSQTSAAAPPLASDTSCWGALQAALRAAQAHIAAAYPPEAVLPSLRNELDLDHKIASNAVVQAPEKSLHEVHQLVLLILGVACGAVVLVALVLLLQRRRLTLLGHVVAKMMPQAGRSSARPAPFGRDMCLVVTDIQDSTSLWECLPPAEMDAAIDLHHACLRTLVLKHEGYESATEGDSFILAFWTPFHALAFALEAQTALLDVAWPARLLEEAVCSPVITSLEPGWPFNAPRPSDNTAEHPSASTGIPSSTFMSPRSSAPARLTRHVAMGLSPRSMATACGASPILGFGGFSRASSQQGPEGLSALEQGRGSDVGGEGVSTPPFRPNSTPAEADGMEFLPVTSYGVLRDVGREEDLTAASHEYGAGLGYNILSAGYMSIGAESHTGSGVLGRQEGMSPPASPSPVPPQDAVGGSPLQEMLWAAAAVGTACPVDPTALGAESELVVLPIVQQAHFGVSPQQHPLMVAAPSIAPTAVAGELKSRRAPPRMLRPALDLLLGSGRTKDVRPSLDLPQAAKHPATCGAISNPLSSFAATAVVTGEHCLETVEGDSCGGNTVIAAATRDSSHDRSYLSSGMLLGRGTNNSGAGLRATNRTAAMALSSIRGDQNENANAAITTQGAARFSTSSMTTARAAGAAPACTVSPEHEPQLNRNERLGDWLRRVAGSRSNASSASGAPGAKPGDPPPAYLNRQRREAADDVYDSATENCVLRGLRVRVGVSLGPINPAEMSHNAASQRTVYGGAAAVLAKAVSDAAHGGMVTLTGDVFERLRFHTPAKLPSHFAIRAGRFSLGSCSTETDVYTIWPASLTQRMALLPPPRCLASAVSPSVYDAPVRRAAVAVLHVPALPALKVWDAAVTTATVGVLCGVAQREARAHGGYLVLTSAHERALQALSGGVQPPVGLVPMAPLMAAFSTALDAARWALAVQEALSAPDCPWPPALLQHELCCEAVLPLLEETHPSLSGAMAAAPSGTSTAHLFSGQHLQQTQSAHTPRRSYDRPSLTGLMSSSSAGRWLQGHMPMRRPGGSQSAAADALNISSSVAALQPQPLTSPASPQTGSPRANPATLTIAPPVLPEALRYLPAGRNSRVSTPLPASSCIVIMPPAMLRKRGSADTATAQLILNQQHRAVMLHNSALLRAQSYASVRSVVNQATGTGCGPAEAAAPGLGMQAPQSPTEGTCHSQASDEHTDSAPLPVLGTSATTSSAVSGTMANPISAQYAASAAMAAAGPMMLGALGLPSAWPRHMYARPNTAWRPVLDVAEERSGGSSDEPDEVAGGADRDGSHLRRNGRLASPGGGVWPSTSAAAPFSTSKTGGGRASLDSALTSLRSDAGPIMSGEEPTPSLQTRQLGQGRAPSMDAGARSFRSRPSQGHLQAAQLDVAQQARPPLGRLPSVSKLLLRPAPAAAGLRQVDISSANGSLFHFAAASDEPDTNRRVPSKHHSPLPADSDAGGASQACPVSVSRRASLCRDATELGIGASGAEGRLDTEPSVAASPLLGGGSEVEGYGGDVPPSPFSAVAGADAIRDAAPGWTLLVRGLRVQVGIDVGTVGWCVPPATARLAYTGHPVLRAEKLAHRARPGQVVLSERANEQVGATQLAQMEEWMDGTQTQGGFQLSPRPSQQHLHQQLHAPAEIAEAASAEQGLRTLGRPLMTAQLPKPTNRLRRSQKRSAFVCRFTRWDQAFGAMYAQVCSPPQPVSTSAQLYGTLQGSPGAPRAASQGGGALHARILAGRGGSPAASQLSREGSLAYGVAAPGRSPASHTSPRSSAVGMMEGMLSGIHKMASGALIGEGVGGGDGLWLGSAPRIRTPPHTPLGGASHGGRSRLSNAGAVLASAATRLLSGGSAAAAAAAAAFGGSKVDESSGSGVAGSSASRLHVSSFQAAVQAGRERAAATSTSNVVAQAGMSRSQGGMLDIGHQQPVPQLIPASAPTSPAGSFGNNWPQAASTQHAPSRSAQALLQQTVSGWGGASPPMHDPHPALGASGSGNWASMGGATMPLVMCTRLDELDDGCGAESGASRRQMRGRQDAEGAGARSTGVGPVPEGVVGHTDLDELMWPPGAHGGSASGVGGIRGGAMVATAPQQQQGQAHAHKQLSQALAPHPVPQGRPRADVTPQMHPMEMLRGKSDFLDSDRANGAADLTSVGQPSSGQASQQAPPDHHAAPGVAGERSAARAWLRVSGWQPQGPALARLPSGYPLSAPTVPAGQPGPKATAAIAKAALAPEPRLQVQPAAPAPQHLTVDEAPLPSGAAVLPAPLRALQQQVSSEAVSTSSSVTFTAPPLIDQQQEEGVAGSTELWPRRYVPVLVSSSLAPGHRGSRILTQLGGGSSGSPSGSGGGQAPRKPAVRQLLPDDGEMDVDLLTRRHSGTPGSGSGSAGSSALSFGKSVAFGVESGLAFGGLAAAAEADLVARHSHVLPGLPEEACVLGGDSGSLPMAPPLHGLTGKSGSSGSSGSHGSHGRGVGPARRHTRHAVAHARDAWSPPAMAVTYESSPRSQQHEIDRFFASGGACHAAGAISTAPAHHPAPRCGHAGDQEEQEELDAGSMQQPVSSDHVLLTMDGLVDTAAAGGRLSVRGTQQLSSLEFWVGAASGGAHTGATQTASAAAAPGVEAREYANGAGGGIGSAPMSAVVGLHA